MVYKAKFMKEAKGGCKNAVFSFERRKPKPKKALY
jgi:hypothetical protein